MYTVTDGVLAACGGLILGISVSIHFMTFGFVIVLLCCISRRAEPL